MKTALLFFLVLGQAADGHNSLGTSTAIVPVPYSSLEECTTAGEAARANNLGLSFLSYTCVPAPTSDDGATPLPHCNALCVFSESRQ